MKVNHCPDRNRDVGRDEVGEVRQHTPHAHPTRGHEKSPDHPPPQNRWCRRTGKPRPGGLGLLQEDGAGTASDAEVREVSETARKYAQMTGFAPLLAILDEAP